MQNEYKRFISKVLITDTCWLWTGSKYRGQYGHFRRKLNNSWKMYKAHRYSYEFYKGEIPSNYLVCHSCDNPSCVNPNHLWIGTSKDNFKDMQNKGRWKNPRSNKSIWLSQDVANQIRLCKKENPTYTYREIGILFNTSSSQVHRIIKNMIWKDKEN